MKKIKALCLTSALIWLQFIAWSQSELDLLHLQEFNTIQNIVYKTVNGDTLDMTLFLPKNDLGVKRPIMLYTHGGGWGGGDKYKIFRRPFLSALKQLLDNGIACAAIEYRLTRKNKSTGQDCVIDCKDAARFLVKNADKYSLNIDRMGVWGGSAGGHLSLMTGLADNSLFAGDKGLVAFDPKFKCIASYYPLVSFVHPALNQGSNFERPERFVKILGGTLSENQELAEKLSPITHLEKNAPPILLIHGSDDTVLPFKHSAYFLELAKTKGADVRLLTVENAGHSFTGKEISPSMEEINDQLADFIISKLMD